VSTSKSSQAYQIPPIKITGDIEFTCCGYQHKVKVLEESGICPHCRTRYKIILEAVDPGAEKFPEGIKVRLTKEIQTVAGCKPVKLAKGAEYVTGSDPFAALGTLEDQTLLRVKVSGIDGDRVLLVPVPNEALEELT